MKDTAKKFASRLIPGAILVAMMLALFLSFAPKADAAAFAYNVYAPNRNSNNTLTGWANLSRDCSNTFGCWNYMKIEKSDMWWYDFVGGSWTSNGGWNSISANLPRGCGNYRTTVDSYNILPGDRGGGVNVGPAGVSANGQQLYEFRTTWSSGTQHYCR